MADNVELNAGSGGATCATDDIGGIQYQRIKLSWGVDGSAVDASASNPLPVTVASTTALTPGTAAANLGKAEDAAHASGDTGVAALAVRRDTPAVGSGTDGDYSTLNVDASGYLYTLDKNSASLLTAAQAIQASVGGTLTVGSHAVTNAGTFAVQAAQSGAWNITNISGTVSLPTGAATAAKQPALGTAGSPSADVITVQGHASGTPIPVSLESGGVAGIAEDSAAAGGEEGIAVLAVRRDTPSSGVSADGDFANLSVDSTGALRVTGSSGTTQYAEDAAHASGDQLCVVGAVRRDTAAVGSGTDGDYSTLNVNSAGRLYTSSTIDAALPAGTNNIGDVDVLTLPNVTLAAGTNTNEVVGDAAHGAAVAGNPLLQGLEGRSTAPTAVDDGDVVRALASLLGKQVVLPNALPGDTWSYAAASGGITNTTGVTAKAAAGAGVRNYIKHVSVINGHATVDTDVQIRDGAAGTVLWRGFAKAAGGGVSETFDPPLRGTANTLVEIANGTTGSATYFNLQGYQAAE